MANPQHGVIKIQRKSSPAPRPISSRFATTAGPKYQKIGELKGVVQLDQLDDARAVILCKTDGGFDLKTVPLP